MKTLTYHLGQWPIGRSIEFTLAAVFWLAVAALAAGCTSAPVKIDEPLTVHDANAARAMALQKIGESGDPETKRLAIFALVTMGQGQAAPPIMAPTAPRSVGEAVFGFLDRTLERALNIAPSYLAYRGQTRAAQTTENVAAINRDVALNQSNNFLQLGVAGITGTQNVGVAGVNALGTVAGHLPPTTNISNNTGPVLVGGGNLNSGSLNPTNPAPVVCQTGAAGVVTCSR